MKTSNTNRWFGLLVFILLLPAFFLSFEWGADSQAWHQTMDLGHFFVFAVIYYLILLTSAVRLKRFAHLVTSTICLVLMLVIELIQSWVGRSASIDDIFYGSAGCLLVLSVCFIKQYVRGRLGTVFAASLIVVICVAVSMETLKEWSAVYSRQANFPKLADFESDIDIRLWQPYGRAIAQPAIVAAGEDGRGRTLKLNTKRGGWSGVRYLAGDLDWSGFNYLNISIYNPGSGFKLGLRIDDAGPSLEYEQRVNHQLYIQPGLNKLSLDLQLLFDAVRDGSFDATAIRHFYLFRSPDEQSLIFYLDDIYLN